MQEYRDRTDSIFDDGTLPNKSPSYAQFKAFPQHFPKILLLTKEREIERHIESSKLNVLQLQAQIYEKKKKFLRIEKKNQL